MTPAPTGVEGEYHAIQLLQRTPDGHWRGQRANPPHVFRRELSGPAAPQFQVMTLEGNSTHKGVILKRTFGITKNRSRQAASKLADDEEQRQRDLVEETYQVTVETTTTTNKENNPAPAPYCLLKARLCDAAEFQFNNTPGWELTISRDWNLMRVFARIGTGI